MSVCFCVSVCQGKIRLPILCTSTLIFILLGHAGKSEGERPTRISASVSESICSQYSTFVEQGTVQGPIKRKPGNNNNNEADCGWYKRSSGSVQCPTDTGLVLGSDGQCSFQKLPCNQAESPESSARIVGGGNLAPGEAGWTISVQERKNNAPVHICGGILIHPKVVLTAAKCMNGVVPEKLEVVAGADNLEATEEKSQRLKVTKFIKHEKFGSPKGNSNDVVLLQAEKEFAVNAQVAVLPLSSMGDISEGSECFATGWGTSKPEGGFNRPESRRYVKLKYLKKEDCAAKYKEELDDSMLCATPNGAGPAGICDGDFGGPLSCSKGNKAFLAGVSSWVAKPCGRADFPSVFSNVVTLGEWIKSNIGKLVV